MGTEQSDAVGNYVIFNVESGIYNFEVKDLPKVAFPEPIIDSKNLATIARMNASSMFIEDEKLPGFEAFKANDENKETRWLAANTNDQYLEMEWVKPQTFNQVIVDEFENHITSYKLQYWENGTWKDVAEGTACGENKIHQFDAVQSSKFRVFILDAKQAPSIKEIKIEYTNY